MALHLLNFLHHCFTARDDIVEEEEEEEKLYLYTCIVLCVLYSRNSVVFVTIHLISRWYVITIMAIIGISCPTYLECRQFIKTWSLQ